MSYVRSKGASPTEAEAPEGSMLHVMLVGELVAGWGFPRRQLYVEYRILYDPSLWRLLPRGRLGLKDTTTPRPGVIRVQCRVVLHSSHPALRDITLSHTVLFYSTIYCCQWLVRACRASRIFRSFHGSAGVPGRTLPTPWSSSSSC